MMDVVSNKVRNFTFFVGAVVVGSTMPDIDHLFPPYKRTWGHLWFVPCVILLCVVVTYFGRQIKSRILRNAI
jgi:protein-S-isoprenylcysteine O-methyltransferase Ste14